MNYKKQIEDLIVLMVKEGASDLHVVAGEKPSLRISGELVLLVKYEEISKEESLLLIKELLTEVQFKKFIENQECDFSYEFGEYRLRGNVYFQRGAAGLALRLIPKVKTLAELNLPPILETFAAKKQGFFLVVGPVGQGKSTTLASMVMLINNERRKHIITVEDPIEYIYPKGKSIIDQREVGIDTKDFKTGLTSAFRQDVDVILIGEMRDLETISTAVTAAETGHLVFSTLHTNSAAQTIDRIIDSFPASQQDQIRIQLAASLLGVFSQRLVPRVSGGLLPAYELLINNNAVSNLIRESRTNELNLVIETGTESGMIDLNRSLVELVRRGEVTVETAYAYASDPHALERLL